MEQKCGTSAASIRCCIWKPESPAAANLRKDLTYGRLRGGGGGGGGGYDTKKYLIVRKYIIHS